MDHDRHSEYQDAIEQLSTNGSDYSDGGHGAGTRVETQEQQQQFGANVTPSAAAAATTAQGDGGCSSQMVGFSKMFCLADRWDIFMITLGFVTSIIKGLSIPFVFYLFGQALEAFGSNQTNTRGMSVELFKLAFDYFYLASLSFIAGFFEAACFLYSSERQSTRLRRKFLEAILTQEVGYFDTDANTAGIINCMTENIIDYQDATGEKIGHFISNTTTALASVALAMFLSWQIGLLTFVVLPLVTVTGGFYNLALANLSKQTHSAYQEADNIVHETVSHVRTVYSYVGEMRALKEFSKALEDTVRLGSRGGLAKGVGLGTLNGTMNASWGLMFWLGAILVVQGKAEQSAVIISVFCIIYGGLCLGLAVPDVEAMVKGRRAAYPIFDIIERVPKVRDAPEARDLGAVRGTIQIQDVHFAYPARPDAMIFRGLSLTVPAGSSVALVGSSGSGKSTVISLVGRFFDPLQGKITVDGHDIRQVSIRSLRRNIGLVGQEPALFSTSIYENILMGRPDATQDDVEAAAKAANIHSFITKLPDGYDTEVGDRGTQLSGGQKQRVAIARAVLKNPAILLLDEATSALDAESERVIQVALDALAVGRSSVVVAHKLSTVRNVDHIAVLLHGELMEWGSHEELMAKGPDGAYFKLIQCQDGKSSDDDSNNNEKVSTSVAAFQPPRPSLTRSNSWGRNFLYVAGGESPCSYFSFEGATPTRRSVSDDRRHSDYMTPRSSVSASRNDVPMSASFTQDVLRAAAALQKGDDSNAYRKLGRLILPEWKRVTMGCFGSVTSGFMRPIFAVIMVQAATSLFKDPAQIQQAVNKWALIFACLSVYSVCTSTIEHSFFGQAGERITRKVREKVFYGVLRNEVGWFDAEENSSAHVAQRLATDAGSINTAVSKQLSSAVNNISSVLFAISIGMVIEWKMALVGTALLPFWLISGLVRYRATLGYAHVLREAHEQASDFAVQAVTNIRTVASFTMEQGILERMNKVLKAPLENGLRHAGKTGFANGAGFAASQIGNGLSVLYLAVALRRGQADFVAMFTVFQVMSNTAAFLSELLALIPQFARVADGLHSAFDVIDRGTEIEPDKAGSKQPEWGLKGRMEFRGVHFHYPSRPDVSVLRDLNLHIDAGRTVALVGESGSGKSSCIALIERFYDVSAGKVLIDGLDIREYNLRWLRRQIALVQQEPCLFRRSIRDNIAYGEETGASESQVIQAAKASNAHSFITALPQGYKTDVGDRGSLLSGGQKQRVAIARAVLKNPKILLLDEATSALDVESERVVQNALDRLMSGRTTLVVAHRLSTIRNADMIVVMKNGRAVESGSHDQLMLIKNGSYANLVASQTRQQQNPNS
ncbi:hypothetical protein Mapa_016392 [Marchantia paleacea]|nr:hypothetical protein Mapa_016392 [Marchantia paleacea]